MPRESERFPSELSPDDLAVSAAARAELARIFDGCTDPDIRAIRLFVAGRGCSGMTYALTFTDRLLEHDHVLAGDGFTIHVDAVAFGYLQGARIDFERRAGGDTFVFHDVFRDTGGSGLCGGCAAAAG